MSHSTLRKGLILVATLIAVAGMTIGPAVAQNAAMNYDSSAAPQAELAGDVTIDHHQMGDDPLTYNNDNGEWTRHAGSVNESVDNPFEFVASDVRFNDSSAFPHSKDASALTASEWTGTATTSDVETADGVDAVQLDFAGSDHAEFSNFSITSDENKRYLSMVLDASTVNAGAVVEVRVVDEDGDYYTAELNTSRSSGEDYIANATGEGYVYQAQLGDLDLTTVGDGTFNDIQKLNVTETGGSAATVEVAALNLDKTSAWDFGDELKDTDDDDELETVQITEHKDGGAIKLADLDSMGTAFDNADIKGLTVPFIADISDLDAEDVQVEFTDAEQYSNYESHFEGYTRFELPDAYDLSYANLELRDTVSVPGTRYVSVEYAEGTGDTAFDDISSWSDITSSYSSVGANVTVDSTVQPGTAMVISYDYVVTGEEQDELEQVGGAGGPVDGGSSGGFLDWIIGIPGLVIASAAGVVGKLKGWV